MKIGIGLGVAQIAGGGGGRSIIWDFDGDPALFQDDAGLTPALNTNPIGLVALPDYPMIQPNATYKPTLDTSDNTAVFSAANKQLASFAVGPLIDAQATDTGNFSILTTFTMGNLDTIQNILSFAQNDDTGRVQVLVNIFGRIQVNVRDNLNQNAGYPSYAHPTQVVFPGVEHTMRLHFHDGVLDLYLDVPIPLVANHPWPWAFKDFTIDHLTMNGLRLLGTARDGMVGGKIKSMQVVL